MEKKESSCTTGGYVSLATTEKSLEVLQKTINSVVIWFSNPIPKQISGENSNSKMMTCTPIFTASLFKIAERWRQPKCPLTDIERMDKEDGVYIYTYVYIDTM